MRVLHLIPSLACGGAERQLAYLTTALVREGIDTHVGFFWKGMHFEQVASSGAGCHWLHTRSNYDPRNTASVLALIRRLEADVVQTWLPAMDIHLGLLAPFLRASWVISERSSAGHYANHSWQHPLRRVLARQADAVTANSPAGLLYWADRPGMAIRRCIPNIIPFEEIAKAPEIPRAATREVRNGRLILVVGRLAPEKNVTVLLEALHRVLEHDRDVIVQIIGNGPLAHLVERQLAIWHPRLLWIRESHEVWSWFKLADLYVSLSLHEGSPNTVLEAAQCGCPMVLSDTAMHREAATTERAVFVPPSDPQLIAAAIESALANPQPRTFSAPAESAGRSTAEVVRGYIALYTQLLVGSCRLQDNAAT